MDIDKRLEELKKQANGLAEQILINNPQYQQLMGKILILQELQKEEET